MMEFTAEMIAGFLGGEIVGDKEAKVHTVSSIEEGRAGSLSYLTNPKYEACIYTTGASVVLVNRTFEPSQPLSATLIKVDDAGACVLKLLEMYNAAKPRRSGISPLASVCAEAQVGEGCYIGDFAVVEAGVKIGNGCQIYPQVYLGTGVSVGEGTILYPGVKVYEGCCIGRNCILHAGAVIGADGFGFMPNAAGGFDKIPQLGNVVIEDDVEIGANTCIDRAKTDSTVIRRGVKLDNLIQ
ncbi:UDP-3-O-(3-hydroxymyristoyl)glucosamine N-acyltransferase, partial [Alistipes onderdonkii]